MEIRKIELRNIRSYVDEKIEFGRGLNFIQGDIGAGKSTILIAVKFALFGLSRGLDSSMLLREGASEGYVRLVFAVNGKEYTITRKLKKGGTEKVLIEYEDGRKEFSPKDANEKVLNILMAGGRFGKQAFSKMYEFALYVPQEQMKEILSVLKKERETKKEIISQIFCYDIYGVARRNANEVRELLEEEIKIAMARLGENFVEIEKRERFLADEREKLGARKEEVEKIEREIDGLRRKVEDLGWKLKNFEKLRKEKEELERKKSGMVASREQIWREIEKLRGEIEKVEKEIEDGRKQLDELRPTHEMYVQIAEVVENGRAKKEKVDKIEKQIQERQGRVDALKEQIAALESDIAASVELERKIESYGDVEKELEKLEAEKGENGEKISGLRTEIGKLKEEIEDAEREIKEITWLAGMRVCPRCRQPLTVEHIERMKAEIEKKVEEKRRLIKEKENETKKINARQVFVESQIKEKKRLLKEKENLQNKLAEMEQKRKEIDKGKKKVELIESEIGKLREEVETIGFDQQEFAENEKKLSELSMDEGKWKRLIVVLEEREKQLENVRKKREAREEEFKSASHSLDLLDKRLGEIKYDEEEHERVRQEYSERHGELMAEEAKVDEIKKQNEEKERRIHELEKELEELRAVKERMERLKGYMGLFEKLADCYEEIEKNVLREARYRLESEFRFFFQELMENTEMDVTLDENFTPNVSVGDGYLRPLENLSGGESTALSLAYRLSLNKLITSNFFGENALLILDEPTDGFSSDQINSLRELLGKIKEAYGNGQIFVVSHEQELEGAADRVYDVAQTGNGTKVKMRGPCVDR